MRDNSAKCFFAGFEYSLQLSVRQKSNAVSCKVCLAEGWVLVSKEGRITLLGGLDVGQGSRRVTFESDLDLARA